MHALVPSALGMVQQLLAAGHHAVTPVLAAPQRLVAASHVLAAPQQDKDTPGRILAMLGLLVVVILGWLLMWRGWRSRTKRQADIAALPEVPAEAHTTSFSAVDGLYVGTTQTGRWLERITARGLGVRSQATVSLSSAGVLVDRNGSEPLFVPAESLRAVGRSSGLAGKVVRDDGIVVLTWQHGDAALDTGVYVRNEAERARLLQGLEALVESEREAE